MHHLLDHCAKDLVFTPELGLERGDGMLLFGQRSEMGPWLQGGGSILEKALLPLVKEGRLNVVLFAQFAHGPLLQEMESQDFELLFGVETSALSSGHAAFPRWRKSSLSHPDILDIPSETEQKLLSTP
jgi:hypothetical protein